MQKRFVNPVMRRLIRWGLHPSLYALVETTGRRSGRARTTPVGYGLHGDTCWVVAEHGRHSDFVKNLLVEPRVRVRMGRRWRTGVARVMPDDDALDRRRRMIDEPNGRRGRRDGAHFTKNATDPLTVRIDLDPTPPRTAAPV
jgi:deazaflavin-dependent oxidoreductase (nitroreductase family)